MLYCGIDIGTSSIKVMIIDQYGRITSSVNQSLQKSEFFYSRDGYQCHEQDPYDWERNLIIALKKSINNLQKLKLNPKELKGIAIVGTSGTIVAIDQKNKPITNAFMYNDCRAVKEANYINECAEEHCYKLGYAFSASFGLSKILWMQKNMPNQLKNAKFTHCTDYIAGLLTGEFGKTDFSNSLKTGYNLIDLKWPSFIEDFLKIPLEKLPIVFEPGDFIASTSKKIENLTDIPQYTPVYAGCTDSTANFISSGAKEIGDLFTVIGSTIVTKVLTDQLIPDKKGRIYSHKFPKGKWILGGAGNCGTLALNEIFGEKNLKKFDKKIENHAPTHNYVYPLTHQGERFPFINPYAKGFEIGNFKSNFQRYTAYIEGLCFIERLMIEIFKELGAKTNDLLYTTGGATKSLQWMTLRASILKKKILIPKIPEAAYGGAIIVASTVSYDKDLLKACQNLVKIENNFIPDEKKVNIYEIEFMNFKNLIKNKMEKEWKENN